MLLYAARKKGAHPFFRAYAATLEGNQVKFEALTVNEHVPPGEQGAVFVTDAESEPKFITIHWPGLQPGLYASNVLGVSA